MRKKLSLKDKLEKLSSKEQQDGEPGPILKTKKVGGADKRVNAGSPVSKSEIDRMVLKIEREFDIEQQPKIKNIEPDTLKTFEVLPSKIKGISALTAVCDKSGKESLSQILYLKRAPETEIQWTVIRDPFAEEFAMIVKEGLRHIKTQPLILGMGVDDGVILASHRNGYTMTLGCYDLKIGELAEIFVSLLRYVERRM